MSSTQHTHDLRSQGRCVRWLSALPPAPPDLDGRLNMHKLVAIGHWNDDVEGNLFSFADLQVIVRNNAVVHTSMDLLVTWEHSGTVTDMQVADIGSGEVLLAVASSSGGICLGRLLIPHGPGAKPEDIQILDMPVEEDWLRPWVRPHKGQVSSVDIHADTKALLTVGLDGNIFLLNPDMEDDVNTPFKRSNKGYVSYTNGRWADSHLFITTNTIGTLEYWDTRQGPKPVFSSHSARPATAGAPTIPAAQQIHWAQVHPSRPNCCVTGGSQGSVAFWDLRFQSQAVTSTPGGSAAGDVWEVYFDPLVDSSTLFTSSTSGNSTFPLALFCSASGLLGRAAAAAPDSMPQKLLQHHSGINSFDVEPLQGQDIVCVTHSQELVYIRRPSAQ